MASTVEEGDCCKQVGGAQEGRALKLCPVRKCTKSKVQLFCKASGHTVPHTVNTALLILELLEGLLQSFPCWMLQLKAIYWRTFSVKNCICVLHMQTCIFLFSSFASRTVTSIFGSGEQTSEGGNRKKGDDCGIVHTHSRNSISTSGWRRLLQASKTSQMEMMSPLFWGESQPPDTDAEIRLQV